MKFPYLQNISTDSNIIGTFKGLNQNIVGNDGEFAQLKNVSDRYYPAIASRVARGTLGTQLTNPHGIMAREHLFYVDGTTAYYNGTAISGLSDLDDGEKQLVNMGAYIVIFPDKKMYNTATGAVENLEASVSGTDFDFDPYSTGSAFTKITHTDIDDLFEVNDAVEISGTACTEYDFEGTHVITDKGSDFIVIAGTITTKYEPATSITIARNCPDMDYVCELDNRIWGCKYGQVDGETVNEIYACALGNPKNWNWYEGTSQCSYAASVGSDGAFTGAIAHMGYVIFFKENTIHMMYGNKPSNFALNTKTLPGVMTGCNASLCIVNQTLFYVGRNGVYAFDGATPSKISENITDAITAAVASQYDDRYYLSCLMGGTQTILVYDTETQLWDVEDDDKFMYASYYNGELHYVDKNKYLTTIAGSRSEVINWALESCDIVASSLDEKYVSKIRLNLMLDVGSEVMLYLKFDDEPMWRQKGCVHSTKNKTYTFPVIPQRCNKFRYKLEGKGGFKLLGLSMDVEGGSELNGSIQLGFRR